MGRIGGMPTDAPVWTGPPVYKDMKYDTCYSGSPSNHASEGRERGLGSAALLIHRAERSTCLLLGPVDLYPLTMR